MNDCTKKRKIDRLGVGDDLMVEATETKEESKDTKNKDIISCSNAVGDTIVVTVNIKCGNNGKNNDKKTVCVHARPDTTDIKVIKEVLQRQVYRKNKIGFGVDKEDTWLDLGANIGTFALYALANEAKRVICIEPEPSNFALLTQNVAESLSTNHVVCNPIAVGTQTGTTDLFLCNGSINKYRHTIYKKRGRQSIKVPIVDILEILAQYNDVNCVKMDIEGAEIDILEKMQADDWRRFDIRKLVFEYTFDIDRSIPRFNKIIATLKEYFDVVYFSRVKVDEEKYNYFPAADMVYCLRNQVDI